MIDDFEFDVSDRSTYEYNCFEHWIHDIRVKAIYENTGLKTPFCISGHGMPVATVADEFDKTLAYLEDIVNADDETTIGEIRPFADDLDAVRFNRNKINRRLSKLDLALVLSRRTTVIRNVGSWHTFLLRECRLTSRYSFYPTARII